MREWERYLRAGVALFTVNGTSQHLALSVETDFEQSTFRLRICDAKQSNHVLAIKNLNQSIDPAKSKVVIKAERLVLKLKKVEVGKEWDGLDDTERKKKEARDHRVKHGDLKGATTEQLLKDMYDNADEEGKRGLREAMAKGEEKKRASGT